MDKIFVGGDRDIGNHIQAQNVNATLFIGTMSDGGMLGGDNIWLVLVDIYGEFWAIIR